MMIKYDPAKDKYIKRKPEKFIPYGGQKYIEDSTAPIVVDPVK
jgi:hypothetical protein